MKFNYLTKVFIVGLIMLFFVAGAVSTASAANVKIIANKDVPASYITADTLKDVFLGKKNSWDNGMSIKFVTMKSGDAHDTFLKTYLQKSAAQFNNYWKQQVFTGKGQMPKSFNSDKEITDFVSGTSGAIGYVSGAADTGSVQIITVK